jgi:hypothetical protein
MPDNTSVFRLSATAGTQANSLSMSAPTEGQLLTIYNEDDDAAAFASQSIAATNGVATFQYINSAWRLVSTNQSPGGGGAMGPTGAAGSAGAAGPTGAAGTNGINGTNGAAGPTGATGSAGPTGPTGVAGSVGSAGPTGPAGSAGSAGTAGRAGRMCYCKLCRKK